MLDNIQDLSLADPVAVLHQLFQNGTVVKCKKVVFVVRDDLAGSIDCLYDIFLQNMHLLYFFTGKGNGAEYDQHVDPGLHNVSVIPPKVPVIDNEAYDRGCPEK
jgi:hypothetical protein